MFKWFEFDKLSKITITTLDPDPNENEKWDPDPSGSGDHGEYNCKTIASIQSIIN